MRLGRTVELALGVIAATDHRQDCPIRRHRDQRRLPDMALCPFAGQPIPDRLLGRILQPRIEGRRDSQVEGRRADQPLDLDLRRIEEIIVVGLRVWRHRQLRRTGPCPLGPRFVDRAGLDHRLQYQIHPASRGLRVAARGEVRGSADQPRKHRRVGNIEVAGFLVEITLGRGIRAVGASAEIGRVQIAREDLLLAEPRFQPQRQHRLLNFAAQRALRRQIGEPRQLLGNRAAAFGAAMAREVAPAGAQHAAQIDPAMLVEPPVFDRNDRLDQVGGQMLGGELLAAIDAARGNRLAPAGSKDNRRGRLLGRGLIQRQGIGAITEEYGGSQHAEPRDQCQPEHRPPEGLEDRHLAPFFTLELLRGAEGELRQNRDHPR